MSSTGWEKSIHFLYLFVLASRKGGGQRLQPQMFSASAASGSHAVILCNDLPLNHNLFWKISETARANFLVYYLIVRHQVTMTTVGYGGGSNNHCFRSIWFHDSIWFNLYICIISLQFLCNLHDLLLHRHSRIVFRWYCPEALVFNAGGCVRHGDGRQGAELSSLSSRCRILTFWRVNLFYLVKIYIDFFFVYLIFDFYSHGTSK